MVVWPGWRVRDKMQRGGWPNHNLSETRDKLVMVEKLYSNNCTKTKILKGLQLHGFLYSQRK